MERPDASAARREEDAEARLVPGLSGPVVESAADQSPRSSTRRAASQSHLAWAGAPGNLRLVIDPSTCTAGGDPSDPTEAARLAIRHVWRLAEQVGQHLGSGRPRSLELSGKHAFTRCEAIEGGRVDVRGERDA